MDTIPPWLALPKPMFLAIRNVSRLWEQIHHWKPALQVFQTLFDEERLPLSAMQ
jgi:hypothetical protein